jgi:hypothetical protein
MKVVTLTDTQYQTVIEMLDGWLGLAKSAAADPDLGRVYQDPDAFIRRCQEAVDAVKQSVTEA